MKTSTGAGASITPICRFCWSQLYPGRPLDEHTHPTELPEHCGLCNRFTDAGLYVAYHVTKKRARRWRGDR